MPAFELFVDLFLEFLHPFVCRTALLPLVQKIRQERRLNYFWLVLFYRFWFFTLSMSLLINHPASDGFLIRLCRNTPQLGATKRTYPPELRWRSPLRRDFGELSRVAAEGLHFLDYVLGFCQKGPVFPISFRVDRNSVLYLSLLEK